ncbi:MAG: SDR family oxidoreductase [Planctomycetota bacterium]
MTMSKYAKMMDLTGKVAVVTGAGGILCSKMAEALADQGASVALLDLRPDAAETVAAAIRARGGKALAVACNVLELESINAAVKTVQDAFGVCDILVNGAGGNNKKATTDFERMSADDFKKKSAESVSFFDLDADAVRFVFNLNFLGTLLPTQGFVKPMLEAGKPGVVINVSSMNAFTPLTKIPAYSAAKAAVSNFTQWLATHFAPANIRVNAIAPGFFLTDQNRFLLTKEDGSMTPRGQLIINGTPMKRYGEADELLGALLWLSCDLSSFVTGIVVPVDGGFSAFSGV